MVFLTHVSRRKLPNRSDLLRRRVPTTVQIVAVAMLLLAMPAIAVEHVTLKRDGADIKLSGKVLVEAQNGGLLMCAPDGVLWLVQPEEIVERSRDDKPFQPLTGEQMAEQLLAEMPRDFRIHHTAHYVICYNTSPSYAEWCGSLFERLFKGFHTYWENLGVKLVEPAQPLVALVFDTQATFARYARANNGLETVPGYYNFVSNRMIMYDLTGLEGLKRGDAPVSSAVRVNQILSQPDAERNVATIVHEATHQLANNSGLQVRMADNPLWVSEGLANYFETPDLGSAKGWRGIGNINRSRLERFKSYLAHRPADSLVTILSDDKRFRDPKAVLDAYAEAWALNYYLLRTRQDEFVAYLKALSEKTPSVVDDADERLTQFKSFFGQDLEQFDRNFVRYMRERR